MEKPLNNMITNKMKLALAAVIISFAVAGYFYQTMPDMMASHWGINGNVDGYMPKFWALFLMPLISLIMMGLFILLPKLDPMKANYKEFQKQYDNFVVLMVGFLFYIYILTLAWNKGIQFNMTQAIIPAFSLLFYFVGTLLEKAKQNWFVGIRTPWTLSNPVVWDKTHKLGAKIFKIIAVASLVGIFLGGWAFMIVIGLLLAASLYLFIYSYLEFKKLNR